MGKLSSQKRRLISLVNQLETVIFKPLYSQEYFDAGHWDYVAYSVNDFFEHLEEAHMMLDKKDDLKFIDVGCGLGTKVHLAGILFDAYGVELNEEYAKVARKVNQEKRFHKYGRHVKLEKRKGESPIFIADALKFDYHDYDVIYFFRPMNNNDMETELEQRIYKQAKPGAIIIPIFKISKLPKNIRKLPTPSGQLFIKVNGNPHAKKLMQKARKLFPDAVKDESVPD